ncbi:MAG: hypothetical protein ACE5FU_14245 [Nitrospinota bacterium]
MGAKPKINFHRIGFLFIPAENAERSIAKNAERAVEQIALNAALPIIVSMTKSMRVDPPVLGLQGI